MPKMKAKMRISSITPNPAVGQESITMTAVAKSESYPADGSDENNTFAKFTPSGGVSLTIQNPDLIGKFNVGQEYYLDFTPVVPEEETAPTTEEETSDVETSEESKTEDAPTE